MLPYKGARHAFDLHRVHVVGADSIEARKAYENAENDQIKVWHPDSVLLMRTRDSLLKESIRLSSHCSVCSCIALESWSGLRADPWICRFLGNTSEAVTALNRAHGILLVTHGAQSELFQGLRHLLDEASAEAAHKMTQ